MPVNVEDELPTTTCDITGVAAPYFSSLPIAFHIAPSATVFGNHDNTQNHVACFPMLKYHCGDHVAAFNPNLAKAEGSGKEARTTDRAKALVSIAPGA